MWKSASSAGPRPQRQPGSNAGSSVPIIHAHISGVRHMARFTGRLAVAIGLLALVGSMADLYGRGFGRRRARRRRHARRRRRWRFPRRWRRRTAFRRLGGGARPGGSAPSFSRPSGGARPSGGYAGSRPSQGSRPNVSTRPSTGARPSVGTRPSTGLNPGSRPNVGTRPSTGLTPGSRPNVGTRPSTGLTPGSRPNVGNLPANRPGVGPGEPPERRQSDRRSSLPIAPASARETAPVRDRESPVVRASRSSPRPVGPHCPDWDRGWTAIGPAWPTACRTGRRR